MPSRSSNSSKSSGSASGTGRALDHGRPARQDHRRRWLRAAAAPRRGRECRLVCDSQKAVNTSTSRAAAIAAISRDQTALADARWPHHADHSAVAVDCAVQQALNGGHLPPPTDQIRLSTADGVMLIAHAQQATGGHRFFGALDPNRSQARRELLCHQPAVRWTR